MRFAVAVACTSLPVRVAPTSDSPTDMCAPRSRMLIVGLMFLSRCGQMYSLSRLRVTRFRENTCDLLTDTLAPMSARYL